MAAHRALWADRPRFLWTLSFLLSVAGTCAVLGGLASLTAFCNDHPPVGMGAGFKTSPEWARESAEVRSGRGNRRLRLHAALVCLPACRLSCAHASSSPLPPSPVHYQQMMRLQKTPVTSSNGEFQCERFFR